MACHQKGDGAEVYLGCCKMLGYHLALGISDSFMSGAPKETGSRQVILTGWELEKHMPFISSC